MVTFQSSLLHYYGTWGWRDGSAVRSTDCSSRGPEFNSQLPHGGSQPSAMGSSVMPFPGVSEDNYSTHINKIKTTLENTYLFKKRKKLYYSVFP